MDPTTIDTHLHIEKVRHYLISFIIELRRRSRRHDASKLEEPEVSLFTEWSPKLSEMEYGSPEYHEALENMGPALQHHYENNRHHPEHFENGIMDMNLFDLMEMLADWKASQDRVKNGSMIQSMKINKKRFNIPGALVLILLNTIEYLEWLDD